MSKCFKKQTFRDFNSRCRGEVLPHTEKAYINSWKEVEQRQYLDFRGSIGSLLRAWPECVQSVVLKQD